jgi:hypothetical protein
LVEKIRRFVLIWKIRENMSWAWPMAKSRTSTKIVIEIGSARASTTPARLIIINELIMRWTLATAYPAEMLGAPRQNLSGIVKSGWNKSDSLNYFTKWESQVISNKYFFSWILLIKKLEIVKYTLESGINAAPWINIAPGKIWQKE